MLSPLMISTITLSFALCATLTYLLRERLKKRAILDLPNERSMHTCPTPRGGGLAVMAVVSTGMALALFVDFSIQNGSLAARFTGHAHLPFAWLLAALLPLIAVSWTDDRKGLSARMRLAVHLAAAGAGSMAFGTGTLLPAGTLPFAADRALMIVGWAWFMNLYNFMDGIDGLTGVQTVSVALGVGALSQTLMTLGPASLGHEAALGFLLMGAACGFLVFNWPPASIFLGDAGSVPLGFLVGFLLLSLAVEGARAPALLLSLYYLADSGITLIRRALRGEKIWQAHREHFYQRAALGEGSAKPVLYKVIAANGALFLASLLSFLSPWLGLVCGAMVVALLLFLMGKSARKARLL